ncbi:zinc finger CCCH domain-containing protein 25-like [Magnolia sinica]|uniref:zinc finger CCCH domain-containing protein 25-like n=1 Tax=Magnolia sinica TaxID=86752 RepID=UPI002657ACF9|nr:zinc finger CCCH domain-containing protein 25-like [Magnolia sinica]
MTTGRRSDQQPTDADWQEVRSKEARKHLHTLFVGNITFDTSVEDIHRIFGRYGKIVDVFIPSNPGLRRSKGYGFIRFMYESDAKAALDILDGRRVDGRIITVQIAKSWRQSDSERHPNLPNHNPAAPIPITQNRRDGRKYSTVVVSGGEHTCPEDVRQNVAVGAQRNANITLGSARAKEGNIALPIPATPVTSQQMEINGGRSGVCVNATPNWLVIADNVGVEKKQRELKLTLVAQAINLDVQILHLK